MAGRARPNLCFFRAADSSAIATPARAPGKFLDSPAFPPYETVPGTLPMKTHLLSSLLLFMTGSLLAQEKPAASVLPWVKQGPDGKVIKVDKLPPAETQGFTWENTAADGTPVEWTLQHQDKTVFKSSSLRGKVVLLTFFTGWDPFSAKSAPLYAKLHAQYSGQNFSMLGLFMDKDRGAVASRRPVFDAQANRFIGGGGGAGEKERFSEAGIFMQRHKTNYPVVMMDFPEQSPLDGVPFLMLFNAQGKLVKAGRNLDKEIEGMVAGALKQRAK